ncbi:MAG: hypothetical protein HC908_08765 [Calothrix sp. SM1_7_51]|nr:hypothetical protein [Calothrix sp. SM1_7_51]
MKDRSREKMNRNKCFQQLREETTAEFVTRLLIEYKARKQEACEKAS